MFVCNNIAVPARPTAVETANPGFDRSVKYQITGLTSASVREACSVDVHGRRRCNHISNNLLSTQSNYSQLRIQCQ